jgi:hypothetical protein
LRKYKRNLKKEQKQQAKQWVSRRLMRRASYISPSNLLLLPSTTIGWYDTISPWGGIPRPPLDCVETIRPSYCTGWFP